MKLKDWSDIHGLMGALVALPFSFTLVTGLFLILRSHLSFMQPPPLKGSPVALEKVISPARAMAILPDKKWNRVILSPSKGIYQFRSEDGFEYVVDASSGGLLGEGPKRTTLFIRLHEGSFFSPFVRDFVFFPSAVGVLILLLSGIWLFIKKTFPSLKRRRKSREREFAYERI